MASFASLRIFSNKRRAKQGLPLIEPLYSLDDAKAVSSLFRVIEYNKETQITDDVSLLYTDAGHIIGSAVVNLKIK